MNGVPCVFRKNIREVFLYLAVGVLGLTLDSAVFFSMLFGGFSPLLSQWVAAGCGAIHNSIWHHYAVFEHDKKLRHTFAPNVAIAIVTVGVSGPLLQSLGTLTGDIVFAKIVVLALTTGGTYFLRKFFIFSKEEA